MTAHVPVRRQSALARYQLSVCVGRTVVNQDCPSLEIAEAAFERFKDRERDNRDAHGGIWDRQELMTVANWRGGPARAPLPTVADIFAKLIARGGKVMIAGPREALLFNEEKGL